LNLKDIVSDIVKKLNRFLYVKPKKPAAKISPEEKI